MKWVGSAFKNEYINNYSGFRIARPFNLFQDDVGGVHTDFHYGGKKRIKNNLTFTVWVPLEGFNKNYTLRIAPGSHLNRHKSKSFSNQKKYISPAVKQDYAKKSINTLG